MYFLGYVLERNLAELLGPELDLVEDEIIDVLREADAAGTGQGLQARGDVDALAEGVVLEEVDVSQVHADAHEEGQAGVLLVVLVQLVLDFHRALERLDGVLEIDEEGVAYRLYDRPVMALDYARDELVVVGEQLERAGLVPFHHAGETGDIGVHYGREPIILLFHRDNRING